MITQAIAGTRTTATNVRLSERTRHEIQSVKIIFTPESGTKNHFRGASRTKTFRSQRQLYPAVFPSKVNWTGSSVFRRRPFRCRQNRKPVFSRRGHSLGAGPTDRIALLVASSVPAWCAAACWFSSDFSTVPCRRRRCCKTNEIKKTLAFSIFEIYFNRGDVARFDRQGV